MGGPPPEKKNGTANATEGGNATAPTEGEAKDGDAKKEEKPAEGEAKEGGNATAGDAPSGQTIPLPIKVTAKSGDNATEGNSTEGGNATAPAEGKKEEGEAKPKADAAPA